MSSLSDLEPAGLVHLYVGDGKGKTTAAVGLAVRALGAGRSVLFCQFLKGGSSSELSGLKKLGAKLLNAECSGKFMFQMNASELRQLAYDHVLCFAEIKRRVMDAEADMVVLDEIIDAVNSKIIPESDLLELIRERPANIELVLTGRDPSLEICEAADYHTGFICEKHPYHDGISARKGIEY